MLVKDHRSYHKLFEFFENSHYTLDNFQIKNIHHQEYPSNFLMHNSFQKKTKTHQNILSFSWDIQSNHLIHCELCVYYSKQMIFNEKQVKTLIDAISFILSYTTKDGSLKIHLVPLNTKKKIHKNQYHISNLNVNSGSSVGNEIFIYRYEECLKVLFHECIHYLNFSNQHMFSEEYLDHYVNKYDLNVHKINFNEAYTEIFARLFYCYYISEKTYSHFLSLLYSEYNFSLYQANKILLFNDRTNVNEKTNTIAYYLITCELFHNLHRLLDYTLKHKPVFYLSNTNSFKRLIFSFQKIKHKKILKNQRYYTTMRMTINNHPYFP